MRLDFSFLRLPAIGTLVAAGAFLSTPAAGAAPTSVDGGTIENSGSTNTAAYRIDVRSDGTVTIAVEGHDPLTRTIAKKSAVMFIANLRAARPLTPGANEPCPKSASFGSSTLVTYHGHHSGDISCGKTQNDRTLMTDVNQIALATGLPSLVARARPAPTAPPTPVPEDTGD